MKTVIDKEIHEVIYIEYQNGLPNDVKTIYRYKKKGYDHWVLYDWDFFINNCDKDDLRHYNSGSGGEYKNMVAPTFVDGYTGRIWVRADIKLIGGKNFKLLRNPIRIKSYYSDKKTTINPFKASEETYSCEYCEKCQCFSTEFCYEHKYEDDNGNARWKSDDSFAD